MAETKAVTRDMLVSELQQLLRLTAFEQTIAAVRRSQAATSSIADELRANHARSVERSRLLQDAVRQVGGVPDVVGSALSKAGALVQTQVDQVRTLQGALLGDLALEHQLRERTRYARTLAQSLGHPQLLPVLDRLDAAHTATIEWLEARLSEVGRTGTSAIAATPVQAFVGATRAAALLPFGVLAATVNRGSNLLRRRASTATDAVTAAARDAAQTAREGVQTAARTTGTAADSAVDAVKDAASTAGSAVSEGVASLAGAVGERAEDAAQAVSRGASSAAETVGSGAQTAAEAVGSGAQSAAETVGSGAQAAAETAAQAAESTGDAVEGAARATEQATQTEVEQVLDLTEVDEDKPPFAGYASLSGDSVMRHVRDSEDVEHLREILAFEQAHKRRKGVVGALDERLRELAGASA